MPFVQKASGYNTKRKKGLLDSLYAKNTPLHVKVFLIVIYSSLVMYTFVVLFSEFLMVDHNGNCVDALDTNSLTKTYTNPDYNPYRYCQWERRWVLLGLSRIECDLARRLLMSVLLGGTIGWERRDSDRPAGIRTMSLVSLGSCLFTITSMFSFMSGPMNWDASRVAAAIPSGVGFLGAGLIWKGSVGNGDEEVHQVHGLTTAASVWLSAAVGVGTGGKLYFISSYCVALIIAVLRFGPRMYGSEEEDHYNEDEDSSWDTDGSNPGLNAAIDNDNNDNVDDVESTNGGGVNGSYGTIVQPLRDANEGLGLLAPTNGSARKRNKRDKNRRLSDVKKLPSFHS